MQQVAEKTHAKLGPSGWDWWSNCPYAPTLSEGLPNPTTFYAAEGSVAHEIADRVLSGEATAADKFLGQVFHCEGHDITVDEEMVDGVNLYIDYVNSRVDGGILMTEQQVPIGHLTGEEGATGTSDTIIITGKRMIVIDLKYGKGVRVNAEGNGQARMYALGALHKFAAVYDDIEEVEVVIVHPRIEDGITSEVLSIGELQEFADEVEIAAGRVLIATEDDLNPGEKQCKFCPAAKAHACPALAAELSRSLQAVAPAELTDFADLTFPKQASAVSVNPGVSAEKLSEFLRAVPLIEAAITAARGECERRLFAGEDVPGFYLGEGKKGNRKWSDEEAAKKAIVRRGRLTKDQAFETKLISPTKAEKLLGKDTLKLLAKEGLVVQAEGKPSVCRDGDSNPPYALTTADDFADLTAQSEAERLLS